MNSQVVRLALQAVSKTVPKRALNTRVVPLLSKETEVKLSPELKAQIHPQIGKREIVCFGHTGSGIYEDIIAFPACEIRYQEPTESNAGVRQKEKGDWKLLTMTEKKELYRYSFCQTYTELVADRRTGQWKEDAGNLLAIMGACCAGWIWFKYFFWPPRDFKEDPAFRSILQKRMIDEYYNPVYGVSHDWDYEKLCWKEFSYPKLY